MSSSGDLFSLFTGIGLSDQKAKETMKNESLANNLKQVIDEVSHVYCRTADFTGNGRKFKGFDTSEGEILRTVNILEDSLWIPWNS